MFAGVTYNFFVINAAVTTELFLLITRRSWRFPQRVADPRVGYFAVPARTADFRSLADQGQPLPPGAQLQALGLQQLFALKEALNEMDRCSPAGRSAKPAPATACRSNGTSTTRRIRLRDGAVMRTLHIAGMAFETQDADELDHAASGA